MDVKNTPLLFQQELNTYYKDILNCEITHPEYWAGKVPETFFLRKRKGIDVYHDWGGDEVLDYIEFDGYEYAIVKQGKYIQIKKWVGDPEESKVENIETYDRSFTPTWATKFRGTVGPMTTVSHYIANDGYTLYIFVIADYTLDGQTTKELFILEYGLDVPNNIDYIFYKNAVRVENMSGKIGVRAPRCTFSSDGKHLFIYCDKFYQIKLSVAWDISKLSEITIEADEDVPTGYDTVKDIEVNANNRALFITGTGGKILEFKFAYNDISRGNQYIEHTIGDKNWVGMSFGSLGETIYLVNGNTVYQYTIEAYKLDTAVLKSSKVLSSSAGLTAGHLDVSNNGVDLFFCFNDLSIYEWQYPTSKILTSQNYNPKVNHSFKRQFQTVKGEVLNGDGKTTTCTGTVDTAKEVYKISISQKPTSTNQYAGTYIYITEGDGVGQIMNITHNDTDYVYVASRDSAPKNAKYMILEQYGETLTFVGGDGLYSIHNDNTIIRRNAFGNSVGTIDACWNNGRVFLINTNGMIICSAYSLENFESPIYGGMYAGMFNSTSIIGSVVGGLRIVPFNSVVLVFTNTQISVIKQESMVINNTTFPTFKMDLAIGFLGLHSMNALCTYNTGVYFVSNKNTFLSVNIEENYYSKYKVTTEDLGVDIQQRMDGINMNDKVSVGIDEETIYITWNNKDKSTIFQYDTFYKFWHRRETYLQINHINVWNNVTYIGPVCYRYNLRGIKIDGYSEYAQHLRRFNGDTDIFSLKTILYHKLYLGQETDLDSIVYYKARLSDGMYEYEIPLNGVQFLQKIANYDDSGVLGNSLLGITPLGGEVENSLTKTYISDVDILEIPLGLTYSLLEIKVEGDFETGGNILGSFVHDPHLTPYEDVVPYLYDN